MKKLTIEEVKKRAKLIHKNFYDYSLFINYTNNRIKVNIVCPIHGMFKQAMEPHLAGSGCRICSGNQLLTTEQFVKKANVIHKCLYDYSAAVYKGIHEKVKIICLNNNHGIFEQTPNSHLRGAGCNKCANKYSPTTQEFIKKAKSIHGDKYDYSLVDYKKNRIKVKIICKTHGTFEQTPHNHIHSKQGCAECTQTKKLDLKGFLEKTLLTHGDKYDYSLVCNIINAKAKITILCKKHGAFKQATGMHLFGVGCPTCRESKGERGIRHYLIEKNINFIAQKKFDECKDSNYLPFDFYLPDFNICIEFDGEQHFKEVKHFGGVEYLKNIQKKDKIKTEFCLKNDISLIRINKRNFDKIHELIAFK